MITISNLVSFVMNGLLSGYLTAKTFTSKKFNFSSIILLLTFTSSALASDSFVTFESGQVRPMVLSDDGNTLYVVNTPDNRLEVFSVNDAGITNTASIAVGMEPVALAVRDEQVWVVNHLSDSISIVDVSTVSPYVAQTLQVGDEPRDIVFAGENSSRAFITAAHRGQNAPKGTFNPYVSEGRADVWVFNVNEVNSGSVQPETIINLMGDTPRALAVSADGSSVYAAIFNSGNQTTVLNPGTVKRDLPEPTTNIEGITGPPTALVVKNVDGKWLDSAKRDWSDYVRVALPDYDVFEIDATADLPAEINRTSGVGTSLFNMVVHPKTGNVYVSNLESMNHIRFEGSGEFAGSTVRGQSVQSRISVISGSDVKAVHLNNHIDYSTDVGTEEENRNSLAFPMQMAISSDGETLYTTAYGSSKIGIISVKDLDNNSFTPDERQHIELSGGGPSGIVLDEKRGRMYVLTRFNNAIAIVDLDTQQEQQSVAMFNPEPVEVVEGRPFLYDARYTSSRGDSACASCHMFGDTDHLVWDLGNPDALVTENPNTFAEQSTPPGADTSFHPMKGPMFSQSLRGLKDSGPQHWRGDRPGLDDSGESIEEVAFKQFNSAFVDIVGREEEISDEEMHKFMQFAMKLTYPPNPVRNLDNQLTASQQRGKDFFFNQQHAVLRRTCNDCHTVDPDQDMYGTNGLSVFRVVDPSTGDGTAMKVPHFRNLYTKPGFISDSTIAPMENPQTTEQIRGFGFRSDGSMGDLLRFLKQPVFTFPNGDDERRDVINYLMAVDSNLLPVVGQQVTIGTNSNLRVREQALLRLNLLVDSALVTSPREQCDLIAKGNVGNQSRGWLMQDNGLFKSDRSNTALITLKELLVQAQALNQQLTFTCVPPGSGVRMAIDRDEDNVLDNDGFISLQNSVLIDEVDSSVENTLRNIENAIANRRFGN